MEIKVCKMCWDNIHEDIIYATFRLKDFLDPEEYERLPQRSKDWEEKDVMCSEFCQQQWNLTWLESWKNDP